MDTNTPDAWYRALPPVTKVLATGTFIVTVLTVVQLLDVRLLLLDWTSVTTKFQVWRLFLDYFFIGMFSFSWIFQMYFLVTFSAKLEQNEIFSSSTPGAYLYFILFQMVALDLSSLILYWPTGKALMATSLHFAIIYYWSRRERWAQVGLWGFNIQAYQLPFALIFLDVLMGGSIWPDLMGLFAGHLYYFLRELLPAQHNVNLVSKCPAILDDIMAKLNNFSWSSVYATGPSFAPGRPSASAPPTPSGGTSSFGSSGPYTGTGATSSSSATQLTRNVSQFSGRGYRLGGVD